MNPIRTLLKTIIMADYGKCYRYYHSTTVALVTLLNGPPTSLLWEQLVGICPSLARPSQTWPQLSVTPTFLWCWCHRVIRSFGLIHVL